MRCIDADALDKQLQKDEELARKRVLDTESCLPYPNNLNPSYTRYVAQMDERTRLKHMVADAPTIEPERRTGKWLETNVFQRWECSVCGERTMDAVMGKPRANFCPNCGADMGEEGGQE